MRYLAALLLVLAVPALAADTGLGVGLWGGYATIQMKELSGMKRDVERFMDEAINLKGYDITGGDIGDGYVAGVELGIRTAGGVFKGGDEVRTILRVGYIGMDDYSLFLTYRGINPGDPAQNIETRMGIDGWAWAVPVMTGWRYSVPVTDSLRVGGNLLYGAVVAALGSSQIQEMRLYDTAWNLKSEKNVAYSPRFMGTGFGMEAGADVEYRIMEKLWAGVEVGYRYMPVNVRSTRDVDTNNDGDTTDFMTDNPVAPYDNQDISKGDAPENPQNQSFGLDFSGLTVAVRVTQEF